MQPIFYFREGKKERRNKCGKKKKNREGGEESGKMKGVREKKREMRSRGRERK